MDDMEIPTYFICPISMQLMRDPVIVSTGITYDRENIEKWLYTCNQITCPVTKQDLYGTDLTPNHTLRRLIQAWCIINSANGIDRIPTPNPPVTKTQILKLFQESKKSTKILLQCIQKLKSIAQGNRSNKKCIVEAGGVEYLASLLKENDKDLVNDAAFINARYQALDVLCHLELSEEDLRKIMDNGGKLLETSMEIFKFGDFKSRAHMMKLLRCAYSAADPMLLNGASLEFFTQMVEILRARISEQATKEALKLLLELCPWGRNRVKAVGAGAVPVLVEILLDSSERKVSELMLMALDQLCRCADGRAALLKPGAGLAVVSNNIFRVSPLASERAVRIIFSVLKCSASSSVLQEMLQVGVVAKLCLVLEVERNGKIVERTRKILSLYSRVWKDSPCIPCNLHCYYPS